MEFIHQCLQVSSLEKSRTFYEEIIGMTFSRQIEMADKKQISVFLKDSTGVERVELCWNNTQVTRTPSTQTHLAFEVEDIDAAFELHTQMNIVVDVMVPGKIYFIKDPDGYVTEVLGKYRNNPKK